MALESKFETSLQPTCNIHSVRETLGRDANVEYTVLIKTKSPKIQRRQTSHYQTCSTRPWVLNGVDDRSFEISEYDAGKSTGLIVGNI